MTDMQDYADGRLQLARTGGVASDHLQCTAQTQRHEPWHVAGSGRDMREPRGR